MWHSTPAYYAFYYASIFAYFEDIVRGWFLTIRLNNYSVVWLILLQGIAMEMSSIQVKNLLLDKLYVWYPKADI